MTHDEILKVIDAYNNGKNDSFANALRAVVELHKPSDRGFDWLDKEWCSVCLEHYAEYEPSAEVKYPCPTIQAIEKELK